MTIEERIAAEGRELIVAMRANRLPLAASDGYFRVSQASVKQVPELTFLLHRSNGYIGVDQIQPHQSEFLSVVDPLVDAGNLQRFGGNTFIYESDPSNARRFRFHNGFLVPPATVFTQDTIRVKRVPAFKCLS